MESSKPSTKSIIGLVAVVLLVIAATAVVVLMSGSKNSTADSQTTASVAASVSPSTSASSSTTTTASSSYKAGSYNATGSYNTPGGTESIGVSVTLASDGTITDATVTQGARSSEAMEYQADFASGYKSQVVGKKITDVNLSRVSGSSLTPIGFSSALDEIKSEAAA